MVLNMVQQEVTIRQRREGRVREEVSYDERGEEEKRFYFFHLPLTCTSEPSNLTCTSKLLSL